MIGSTPHPDLFASVSPAGVGSPASLLDALPPEEIGRRVRWLRVHRLQATQKELGEKVGLGHQAVSDIERGFHIPKLKTQRVLCLVLGVTAAQLLGEAPIHGMRDEEVNRLPPSI